MELQKRRELFLVLSIVNVFSYFKALKSESFYNGANQRSHGRHFVRIDKHALVFSASTFASMCTMLYTFHFRSVQSPLSE